MNTKCFTRHHVITQQLVVSEHSHSQTNISYDAEYFPRRSRDLYYRHSRRTTRTAAARGAPRHDQRSLSGVYDTYVLERCMSESEDITADILERCISQSEKSIWRCVKSSRESGEDKNELGCGIRPKMNVSDRIFGCFGNTNTPELATVTTLRLLLRPSKWRPFC